jgi:hypothetical protein
MVSGSAPSPGPAQFNATGRKRLFFMHIPKTAGTSMRLYLRNQYDGPEVCAASGWRQAAACGPELARYRLVQGHFHFNLTQVLAPETNTLTVLREPVARTISALLHLRRDPKFHALHEVAKDLTLPQMLRHPVIMAQQRNIQAAHLCASAPPHRVFALCRDQAGDPGALEAPPTLSLALERLARIDHLACVEDLPACAAEMSRAMDFHPAGWLPVMNQNPQGDAAALTEADLEILRETNRLDLELYAAAGRLIAQRRFEAAMRRLLAAGVYRVLPGSFEVSLDGAMPGSGWYEPEGTRGRLWRWTGPEAKFSLELPLRADADYQLRLHFVTRAAAVPCLTATLNAAPARLLLSRTNDGHIAALDILRAQLGPTGGLCRILFDTGETSRAADRAADIRPLGIAVNRIALICRP